MHTYIPRGVCSRQIDVELDGDTIKSVQFTGGCDGNLKAISKLVAGQNVDDIVAMMEGHTCGRRSTSCVDQMTKRSYARPRRRTPSRRKVSAVCLIARMRQVPGPGCFIRAPFMS